MKKLSLLNLSKFFFLLFTLSVFFGCQSGSDSPLIYIDTSQAYPESDLKLSDVAEVRYIPLQFGKDSIILVNPGQITVLRDAIFVLDRHALNNICRFILYDLQGNPLRAIDRRGRGPQEYISLNSYTLDTVRREIYGWDKALSMLLVYDFEGNFKRSKKTDKAIEVIANVSSDDLLGYHDRSRWINFIDPSRMIDKGNRTFTFIDKDSLSESALGFDYAQPGYVETFALSQNLSYTKDGVYISNARSDTTYFMDREHRLTPRIVDQTPYSGKRMGVIRPALETERYLFLSREYLKTLDDPGLLQQQDFYVYDKKKKQLYTLPKDPLQKKEVGSNVLLLMNNRIALYQFTATQNHNYAAVFLSPGRLHENESLLPPELKRIADTLEDTDNPVLMLMKFK